MTMENIMPYNHFSAFSFAFVSLFILSCSSDDENEIVERVVVVEEQQSSTKDSSTRNDSPSTSNDSAPSTSASAPSTSNDDSASTSPSSPVASVDPVSPAQPSLFEGISSIELPSDSFPEDTIVLNDKLYISNWGSGGIITYDLDCNCFNTFASPEEGYDRWWGLEIDEKNDTLFSIQMPTYNFRDAPTTPGRVQSFNATTGAVQKTWPVPVGVVFNAMKFDGNKYLYLNEISHGNTLYRIDITLDGAAAVQEWVKDDVVWPNNNFGHGGMALVDGDVYSSINGQLFKIAVNSDGSAATPQAVTLIDEAGNPFVGVADDAPGVRSDGMASKGRNIYFNYNDAANPDKVGKAFKIALSADGLSGTIKTIASELDDPSGIIVSGDKVLINESQFGKLVGNAFDAQAAEQAIVAVGDALVITILDDE